MVYSLVLSLAFVASLATCEPPVQGYNYRQPQSNGFQSNSYVPPSAGYTPPNNYLPPTSFGHSGGHSGGLSGGHTGSGHSFGQTSHGHDSYDNGHDHGHGHDNEVPKSYEFGYSVKDAQSGNDYGRRESSDGNVVRGEYRVQLPDGRMQIVTYHADWQTGFHADVRYEGEARYPEPTQNQNQGYNYNAPSTPSGFSGSLTGFHGNGNFGYKPTTAYGPPGYNYNAPSTPSGFSGSLTGFHGNGNFGYKPTTAYGPPGYHR